ncbi:hypothetical protein HW115_04000 [Verrucomicrobiaceae bacterium N1E253]|uniref:Uncharacterized protein n=1 Tax=Oceaniferula marina TaxID=2748318 RepID=A0A851GAH3_9BACT|nr:hypothetical protein [Oceaniferula marina]NWK54758.1 hypothetical protein [Oceaniferula marina]
MTFLFCGATLQAGTVTVSHGTVSGSDDADQAGPIWGMGVTPSIGVVSGQAEGPLFLTRMEFQSSSSGTGTETVQGDLFLQVYDGFEINQQGEIIQIGKLVTASSHSLDSAQFGKNQTLSWSFDGQAALDPEKQYAFVMASDREKEATVNDHEHLVPGAFELRSQDSYAGGDGYTARGKRRGWDLEFKATFERSAPVIQVPSAILGLGGMTLVLD